MTMKQRASPRAFVFVGIAKPFRFFPLKDSPALVSMCISVSGCARNGCRTRVLYCEGYQNESGGWGKPGENLSWNLPNDGWKCGGGCLVD